VSDSHLLCHAHAMLWPCRSSQGHGTARPSQDGLWANCPRSAFSGYHAEFHEDCYLKHTNPPHNYPFIRLKRVVAAHYKKDDLLSCCTSSSDISGYHAEFHEDCYLKHTNPPHNDPFLRLKRVVAAHYKKDDLLSCCTSSSDISGYHADSHEGHGTVGAWQGRGMACVN
jgi:uncharacterized C2H2 Zn-finger protein